MKYYIDFEFSEYFTRTFLGKKIHTIDLISIGIVAEDGRTYYAIGKEFSYFNCSKWVRENVITKLDKTIKGKSNKEIASDIFNFINPDLGFHISGYSNSDFRNPNSPMNNHFNAHNVVCINEHYYAQPTFVGYYCDYDWVLFCSLFGTMMNLPPGFPMYCRDLKQTFDEIQKQIPKNIKEYSEYPQEVNEHNALDDAKWIQSLDNFLNTIK